MNAPLADSEFSTKWFTFEGDELEINYSTSAAGQLLVELLDAKGKPIPGFTASDCEPIYGDHIARVVRWKGGADVSRLSGQIVKLNFKMSDADLFSFRFRSAPAQNR